MTDNEKTMLSVFKTLLMYLTPFMCAFFAFMVVCVWPKGSTCVYFCWRPFSCSQRPCGVILFPFFYCCFLVFSFVDLCNKHFPDTLGMRLFERGLFFHRFDQYGRKVE